MRAGREELVDVVVLARAAAPNAATPATDTDSIALYGQWWAVLSFPGQSDEAPLEALELWLQQGPQLAVLAQAGAL